MSIFNDLPDVAATREAALARLQAFLPHAGERYTDWRNHDFGPAGDNAVSVLSPWLRHRLISEQEVVAQVMANHGLEAAEKYIQEVCWRSYWKGYLERRPVHWPEYQQQCRKDREAMAKDRHLAMRLEQALSAQTGIACFDGWVDELITHGYLHNHARMWFASIWVFTLELPWALGADFFLRHLLDGDPASNTLSWRWVAGLHTQGKAYLARPDNITRFTQGRFPRANGLADKADLPASLEKPPLQDAPAATPWRRDNQTGLLITEDDLTPEAIFGDDPWPFVTAIQTTDWRSDSPVSQAAKAFAQAGLADALARNTATEQSAPFHYRQNADATALCTAIASAGITTLLTPWIPTGPGKDAINALMPQLAEAGITLQPVPRDWDVQLWPAATHGFFRFWKAARPLLEDGSLT